jgi:hypothetical protein
MAGTSGTKVFDRKPKNLSRRLPPDAAGAAALSSDSSVATTLAEHVRHVVADDHLELLAALVDRLDRGHRLDGRLVHARPVLEGEPHPGDAVVERGDVLLATDRRDDRGGILLVRHRRLLAVPGTDGARVGGIQSRLDRCRPR